MLTIPDHMSQAVPRGGRFIYLAEISPAAPDSWSAYRCADIACKVDDTDEFEGGIKVGYDNYSTVDVEGYLSGPLSDNMRGRIAVRHVSSSEGWQESVSRPGDELGERDERCIRAMLEIDSGVGL